ncbi:thermostable carboxypeptidase 1 [Roseovarius sp. A-2]|uniref:carboxypeptidase M32 n=1 Tax=Roseovarius sp. A-2 TaxID=1570360 RepID=UPI0009B587FA|nr:carboxypeptidase M32 [Roseovarius sp. A-2]GAW36733.1 thermostable carboxypeptidase 1 [Roseovarius sp. A-2]
MTAYDDLIALERDTQALAQVAGRLGWDQETMMPRGAAEQRSEETGAIQAVLHARRCDLRRGDLLARAEADVTDEVARAQLRHIRRDYDRATLVPGDLAVALARLTSRAQGQWAEARAGDDYAAFAPVLAEVIRLKREEAAAVARGRTLYDALIDDFEPDMTAARLDAIFAEMRPRLVDLRARALERDWPALDAHFDEQAQLRLSRELARNFGYDFARGRLDMAVHPFSSGSGDDVRITTRVNEHDPFNCLYSTIHEVGHACYEQGIDPDYRLTPLGQGVSMGVHESQSRIYENQLGRSRAYTGWLFERMRDTFGDFGVNDAETFYRAVNRVHRGHIRTEADEVQYNLHIMLRFDLEKALIAGDLSTDDLEAAWNDRFEADFGYAVDRASNGVLQDVHWSVGLFGYFPTYSLGNVYAGCLFQAMRGAVPDLEVHLSLGDLGGATSWLRAQVQRHGGRFAPAEVIARACGGAEPTAGPLLDYLEEKFGAF